MKRVSRGKMELTCSSLVETEMRDSLDAAFLNPLSFQMLFAELHCRNLGSQFCALLSSREAIVQLVIAGREYRSAIEHAHQAKMFGHP